MTSAMKAKSVAQEITNWYLKKLDPLTPHDQNVHNILRPPVLHATLQALCPERQTTKEQDWDRWDPDAYESLNRRDKARMDAFLEGCTLAIPQDSPPTSNRKVQQEVKRNNANIMQAKTTSTAQRATTSPIMTSIQDAALLRSLSNETEHAQLRASELCTRLRLYFLSLTSTTDESTKASKARAACIVQAFVATVGCVRRVGPTLRQLLETVTKEIVCVELLSGDVQAVILRVVSEYEHQVSFASLAFLSSPEDSAEQRLAPLVLTYLQYIKQNRESILQDCEMECTLASVLNPKMRYMFKNIEFQSIGHLLEVCQGFQYELQNIELPPPGIAATKSLGSENPCDDTEVLKQAMRDLQREVLTVNGHVLPPVKSRKELVQLLTRTLNSRSLFRRKNRYDRRAKSFPSRTSQSESEGPFSSGNEGDYDLSGTEGQTSDSQTQSRTNPARSSHQRRQSFQLSTIDIMTRRLLVASSRTGMGGDAFFVVRDLFGGDDIEVVPSGDAVFGANQPRTTTIEIVVRLSSVTIKCHASFDVYPKSSVGDCEPLIQLHTITTETINLQEVRASDSEGYVDRYNNGSTCDDSSDDDECSKLVLREKRTEKTGWRTISIRPALYEAVGQWNTPS